MTEKEKMLAGHPYQAWDDELVKLRENAKLLCHQFNYLAPNETKKRNAIMSDLLNAKDRFHIEANFFCDYGENIYIGDNFYSNHNLVILDVCQVSFGNNVMLGPNVMIATASHPLDPLARRSTEFGQPISIGNDVWIGGNVSVLAGVSIGDNSVIGAGSVVTKDITGNGVYAGNPCQFIKSI